MAFQQNKKKVSKIALSFHEQLTRLCLAKIIIFRNSYERVISSIYFTEFTVQFMRDELEWNEMEADNI